MNRRNFIQASLAAGPFATLQACGGGQAGADAGPPADSRLPGGAQTPLQAAGTAPWPPLAGRWYKQGLIGTGAFEWIDLLQQDDGDRAGLSGSGEWGLGIFNGVDGPVRGTLFATGSREGGQIELRFTYFESGAVIRTTMLRLEAGPEGLRGTEDGTDIAFATAPRLPDAADTPLTPSGESLDGDWEMLDREGDLVVHALEKRTFNLQVDVAGRVTGAGTWATAGVLWIYGDTGVHSGALTVRGEVAGDAANLKFDFYAGQVVDRTATFTGTLAGSQVEGTLDGQRVVLVRRAG